LGIVRSLSGRQFVGTTIPPDRRTSTPFPRSNYTALPKTKRPRAESQLDVDRDVTSAAPRRVMFSTGVIAALVVTLLTLLTAAFAVDPVRDAATLQPVGEASLTRSASYLAIEPISSALDTLTLLTVGQHIALLLWVIGLFIVVRVWLARGRRTTARREVAAAVALLAAILITYAAGAVMPRPMAQLVASDPNIVFADFHAHTKYSHDGRSGWSEDDVREWHRGAGFDVAYITDHATFEGAERGVASNPGQAGQGTILLQGLEAFYKGEHVNILNAGRRYKGITTADLKDVDEQSLMLASLLVQTAPILIETLPGNLSNVVAAAPGKPGVSAIEIVDGSPRGLSQTRRERRRIVHLADSLNLALVTGSDNHGWGRAAPGWTMLAIPGWRGMSADSLTRIIEDVLRMGRRQGTRTVERAVAGATNVAVFFALPAIVWRMFSTLSPDERVAWLIWTWAIVLIARGLRRYRVRPSGAA
jgi:predicted metal-dependent phosphoesterase TrpH